MRRIGRGLLLLVLALGMMCEFRGGVAVAQTLATTSVSDTVLRADGTAAAGSVVVSWGAFTTANGIAVPAGSTTVTLGANGALSVALAPNAGATPMGSYYTAVYHLNDGTVSKEFWVIPPTVAGGGPVKLAGIRNQVLPTSVAMQTVSKQYVDNAIAQAQIGAIPMDQSPYVLKAGDTMTGPLVLPGDPATPNQAADKNYVDANVAALTTGLGGKVSLLPSTTQQVQQPANTELDVSRLNGSLYAKNFGVPSLANALASPECNSGNGCSVVVEQNNGDTEQLVPVQVPAGSRVADERGGGHAETVTDPLNIGTLSTTANTIVSTSSRSQVAYSAIVGNKSMDSAGLELDESALGGGNNQLPTPIETPPYGKSTYHALAINGRYNTQGQHITNSEVTYCFGVGDCLGSTQFVFSAGGARDPSDEGTHPSDLQVAEDFQQYEGTCSTGCTTGSTSLFVTATLFGGTQGDGRYLIDLNPANVITTGHIAGGADAGNSVFASAQFSGTNFPVSVFLQTASAATSQAKNIAPGQVTLPIQTSGVPSGFATSTAALPATSGIACVADPDTPAMRYPNFETANYTVVDASHIQLTLNKVHVSGAVVAVGGLCGYGLVQTADSAGALKQAFPVVGSTSATGLYYADGGAALVGRTDQDTTSAYANVNLPVASIARTGNVVTATLAQAIGHDINGLTMAVSGVADPSYNGSFVVTSTSAYTVTYPNTGADSTSSGGSIGFQNGGYALYPMAEVLSVYNPATRAVDGTMTLAPNTVPWAAGDAVEEPHYYLTTVYADSEIVGQFIPRPSIDYMRPGKTYTDSLSVNFTGWDINNSVGSYFYYGGGGTHVPPDAAYRAEGVWRRSLEVDAGTEAVLDVHCNLETCKRWNSDYNLVQMDSATGTDALRYAPESNQLTFQLGGRNTTFGAGTISTDTINAHVVNAGSLSGSLDASVIATGVLNPARLPVFGPSGATHAPGAVPDPGATAGTSRYLREDGTWATLPTGSSSAAGAAGAVQVAGSGGSFVDSGCTAMSGSMTCNGYNGAAGTQSFVSGNLRMGNYLFAGSYDGLDVTTSATGKAGVIRLYPTTPAAGSSFELYSYYGGSSNYSRTRIDSGAIVPGSSVFNAEANTQAQGGIGFAISSAVKMWLSPTGKVAIGNGTTDCASSEAGCVNGVFRATSFRETLTTPVSSAAACTAGDFTDDASYHYVCVAANTWKRVALSAF